MIVGIASERPTGMIRTGTFVLSESPSRDWIRLMSESPITMIRGACPHDCPDGCATITEVQDGRAIRFYGDPDHPITRGWLCAKVRPYLERVYDPNRLLHPLRRVGPKGSGEWARISWDEALAEIASKWRAIIAEHGAAAILPYSYSGTLGMVEMGVANERFWQRLGASGLDRTICDAAATAAVNATYGASRAPDPRDVIHSKMILIWGHNPASTGPHFMPILREAQHNGTQVIVIDPRRTLTARSADLHVAPKPGTDAALALGMMHVIFRDNLHAEAWLEANAIGWRALRDRAAEFPPARVSEITDVPADQIELLAREFAAADPAMLKIADGINRHLNGGQTVRALICLPAIAGHIGKLGGGLFYSQSGHVRWDREAVSHASESPEPTRIVNMNRLGAALTGEASDPPIKALYVYGANPAASAPNSGLIDQGLRREDLFTVVHEQFLTDTALLADLVLPATTQLEQTDLIKPYGHQHFQYNHQAIAPLGEAKSNWTVMQLLASALGFDEPWLHQSNEAVIAEVVQATSAVNPRLEGVTIERLKTESTVPYAYETDDRIPFAGGCFPTPSGKLEMYSEALAAQGLDPLPNYVPEIDAPDLASSGRKTLTMLSGAAHHFTSSTFSNQASLRVKEGPPSLEINPADAAERGILDGQAVKVENGRGWCQLRAVVTDGVRPGVVVATKGHWSQTAPGGHNVNWLTSDALADFAGGSTFHSNSVTVSPWSEPNPSEPEPYRDEAVPSGV